MFILLQNHVLDHFLIEKGNMGNKLSLSMLLVSLVLLSHFFHHILIFVQYEYLNGNNLLTSDRQPNLHLDRLDLFPLAQHSGPHLLLYVVLEFIQYIFLVILVTIITGVNSLADCIHRAHVICLAKLFKYLFDVGEEFPSRTCTIGFRNIVTHHLPVINCISVTRKFLPDVKELFDKPPQSKRRRSRYVIYKKIDTSYYGDSDDKNGILEKFEQPMEEDMRARALSEWKRIESI
jgi:hypothetical protein